MDAKKIEAGVTIAFSLIQTAMEIYDTLKSNRNLSEQDLMALIDRQNDAQAKARAGLLDLIGGADAEKQ